MAATTTGSDTGERGRELRQLTIVYCDLVGSSSLLERLGVERYKRIQVAFLRQCEARGLAVLRHGYPGMGRRVRGMRFDWPEDRGHRRRAGIPLVAQQAKSLGLRTAMGLARFWCDQGRRAEARHLLAPVYGWFREGLGTKDLADAKALLAALA